ncbi:protein-L-isoaspartate(D-aspartate) O-methyltransferase [Ectothiorhodospiraceae bacterium 2226]|nr:protein-L-isoaspartate(D-aspartate) O-methyltransferase [Ectothiorhodospiraceae bacterium 2226]
MRKTPDPRVQALIECLARDFKETAGSTGLAAPDARLVAALRRVPRDRFVPPESRAYAWENTALPIGYRQTISQPFIVALMTQLLDLAYGARVLEIGTGSGYQAAVLAELGAEVYSIEVVPELAAEADARLSELGYGRVHVRAGDGREGWPEAAPFDAVIVTAGGEGVPPALVQQLKPGGRLVMPVARGGYAQELVVGVREPDGGMTTRDVLAVAFVPLI